MRANNDIGLGRGTLTGKYLNGQVPAGSSRSIDPRASRYKKPNADEATESYVNIAREYGMDPAQMAIAFVNRQPFLTSNIIGATSMEQLRTNIGAAGINLPDSLIEEINGVHALLPNPCP